MHPRGSAEGGILTFSIDVMWVGTLRKTNKIVRVCVCAGDVEGTNWRGQRTS